MGVLCTGEEIWFIKPQPLTILIVGVGWFVLLPLVVDAWKDKQRALKG